MDKENMEFKMRAINSQIFLADKFIRGNLVNKNFSFIEKFNTGNDFEVFSSWQLEINIEMIFIKIYVFLEYLEELGMAEGYKIDKKLLKAGLRQYVAHKGSHKDFHLLNLPANTLVVAEKIEIENDQIFFTLLNGNHTQKLSMSTPHKINITEKIFKPHFDFIKDNYPDWLK